VLVIFDCDGVLVDSEEISCGALARRVSALGHPLTTQEVIDRYQGMSWASTVAGLEAEFGRPLPPTFAAEFHAEVDAELAAGVEAVEGVREVLEELGHPACVASSGRPEKMALTLGRTGLLPFFEGRLFSATQVARGKPAPDLFLHAAEQMGFAPVDCLVVEDSPVGIAAAGAAGMRALHYGVDFTDMRLLGDALVHEAQALEGQ
jgi:HAD superfamily hydrolase (TIGR01509 family)